MKNIRPYESLIKESNTDLNYFIDWSLFEGEIEYDSLTEKLHVVFSEHGKAERMKDFKIEPWEIEGILNKASSKLIDLYKNSSKEGRKHYTLRDRTIEYPFELIVVYDNDEYQTVVKTNIAIVGELYDAEKVKELKRKYANWQLNSLDPDKNFLRKIFNMERNNNLVINPEDFVFQVITTRRKRNFLMNKNRYPDMTILEVYPEGTIEVNK
jgi:hypothetical protein